MENCLVTKLKVSVENSNLDVLNNLRIKVRKNSDTRANNWVRIGIPSGEVTIRSDKYFTVANDEQTQVKEYVLSGNREINVYPVDLSTDTVFYVESKYVINRLGGLYVDADLSDLSYVLGLKDANYRYNNGIKGDFSNLKNIIGNMTNLSCFSDNVYGDASSFQNAVNMTNMSVAGIKGNVSSLAGLTNLTGLTLSKSPELSGNLSSLATLVNMTWLSLGNTQIQGTIEDFVRAIRTSKSSGSITCVGFNTNVNITFDGSNIQSDNSVLTWSPNASDQNKTDISFDGRSITI